ncbi:MAG: acyl carrier protein [Myxococcota bacterium]
MDARLTTHDDISDEIPKDILDGIRHVASTRLDLDCEILPSTDLLADLELDSLQQLTLIVELENHFRICFEPEDEEGVATVQDLMNVIDARRKARPE